VTIFWIYSSWKTYLAKRRNNVILPHFSIIYRCSSACWSSYSLRQFPSIKTSVWLESLYVLSQIRWRSLLHQTRDGKQRQLGRPNDSVCTKHIIISPLFLPWKNKSRLMRSRCCLRVCLCVILPPPLTFECRNKSLWNQVRISWHLSPSQRRN
jgi:hypothetical protein